MIVSAVLVSLSLAMSPPKARPTVELYQGFAVVREGLLVDRAPLMAPTIGPRLSVAYRRNDTFAVWDERGLTVRVGQRMNSTHLEDIAVSPRAQTVDGIKDTLAKIQSGDRQKGATALAGSCRLGTLAFFLVRWTDRQGDPWLEALVSVDLSKNSLHPRLVGRFDGFSAATQPIDQQLLAADGKLLVFTQNGKQWGRSTYAPDSDAFSFDALGAKLVSLSPEGYFVEKAEYGLYVAGQINRITLERRTFVESRNLLRFLDDLTPPLIAEPELLHNGGTGAVVPVPKDFGVVRVSDYVVVYTPSKKPTSALLYRAENWKLLDKTSR
jgi:hypothetical protein